MEDRKATILDGTKENVPVQSRAREMVLEAYRSRGYRVILRRCQRTPCFRASPGLVFGDLMDHGNATTG